MIKLKPSYKKVYILGLIVSLGVIGVGIVGYKKIISSKSNIEVKISDFPSGTRVNYEIMAGNNIIEDGSKIIEEGSILNLPMPDNIPKKDNEILSYKLKMQPIKQSEVSPSETLDMLLKLNPDNGSISVTGSGLNGFSDINIKKGKNGSGGNEKITSDWAGLFSMEALNSASKDQQDNSGYLELAFQNIGIASDFDQLNTGKIEVGFLGDDAPPTREQVRLRYSWALRKMTEELTAIMVLQTGTIGMFFDASIQLDAQRKQQELMARAHKDYHPSEQMCRIGTFIRSVANSESKAEINKHALNKILMNQYLGTPNNSAGGGPVVNNASEIELYKKSFCDPRDNSGSTAALCPFGTTAPTVEKLDQMNKDVDYTRMIGGKLTVDVDFADGAITGTANNDLEGDEAGIIALAKNLYFPNVFEVPEYDRLKRDLRPHYDSRSFAAKMNVAHSSFLNILGMKSRAPAGKPNVTTDTTPSPAPLGTGIIREPPAPPALQTPLTTTRTMPTTILTEDSGWAYMKAMLREFGIVDENASGDTNDEIDNILGERPSYYAQMEVLTKKIYQHPNFYTNLYDKPANVARIGASIDAITLMNQRDRFESILRREMLTSLLIEEELGKHVENVNSTIYEQMQQNQF